jgi:TolA-binding protein
MLKRPEILLIIFAFITFFSCSEKKTEAEYFQVAYDQYNKEQYDQAIENFKNVVKYYPEGENTPKAIFMIGYIYANNVNNLEEAKKYYETFLAKYPNDDLADDAQYELQTLGQDINDLPVFKNTEKNTEQVKKE